MNLIDTTLREALPVDRSASLPRLLPDLRSRDLVFSGGAPFRPTAGTSIALPRPLPARVKPLLRGWSHFVAFFGALGGAIYLASLARSREALLCALFYGGTTACVFGTSALYHCPFWSLRARRSLKVADHSLIFVFIAGTLTPFSLVLGAAGRTLIFVGWSAAVLGIARAVLWSNAPKPVIAIQAVITSWVAIGFFPELPRVLDRTTLLLLLSGGLIYTAGAAVFACRRPNPWPRVFGFHEIFHLLVIVGAMAHFAAVCRVISTDRTTEPGSTLALRSTLPSRVAGGPVVGSEREVRRR
jgi:hemolysin III